MAASTMRAHGPGPVDVVVIDVSATGVRIATLVPLAIGQEISIGLAGAGATRAFVAWARDGQYGCQFERPLEPDGDARAFSSSRVVHLGRSEPAEEIAPRDDLRDLWAHHRHLRLPLDATLVVVALIIAIVIALWRLA
jgi:hypothetical protein